MVLVNPENVPVMLTPKNLKRDTLFPGSPLICKGLCPICFPSVEARYFHHTISADFVLPHCWWSNLMMVFEEWTAMQSKEKKEQRTGAEHTTLWNSSTLKLKRLKWLKWRRIILLSWLSEVDLSNSPLYNYSTMCEVQGCGVLRSARWSDCAECWRSAIMTYGQYQKL